MSLWRTIEKDGLPSKIINEFGIELNRTDFYIVRLSNGENTPAEYIYSRNGWFGIHSNKPLKNVIAWHDVEPYI